VKIDRDTFERLYAKYNRRKFVHPDPLEFLYLYDDPADREVVGLIASSLAYGRVQQILDAVSKVLDRLGPRPAEFLRRCPERVLRRRFDDFRHRFTSGREVAGLLSGIKGLLRRYGDLQRCFLSGMERDDETVLPALEKFVERLHAASRWDSGSLLPHPGRGSACKRLNLYLRWMVRRDEVDPGGWDGVPTARLIVPLDTHMHKICRAIGFTARRSADMRTAIETTMCFRRFAPEDPVRYDFCLTRLGIRADADFSELLVCVAEAG